MPLPLILLIRHGETDWNAEARYQGQTDILLNERGRAQAVRNGEFLKQWLAEQASTPDAFDYVSSTLSRAVETLAIVRRRLGVAEDAFRRDPRLMEANYGIWEGLTVPEIRARDPEGYERRKHDPLGFAPQGGESYAAVGERAFAALSELTRPTIVVAHGGVSKVIRGRILKLSPAETMALPVPQDRIHRIADGQVDTF
jgi:probable phosphoglycerate mutase